MNKQDLVKALAEKVEVTSSVASKFLDALADCVKDVLKEEGKIVLPNIGTFEVKDKAERTGCNPKTGEKIVIPASKAVGFKATKCLKESVNE